MKKINEQMTTMTTTSEALAEEVHKKRSTKLDAEKVAEVMSQRVNEHFDDAVQKPVEALRSDLEGFREEMGTLGAERLSEARIEVERMLREVNSARQHITELEHRVDFVGFLRLALALVPLCTALILVGGLVWGVGSMFGIGPLFGWIWASFTAASLWWHKLLIALGGLGAAALFVWIVLRVSQWVHKELR